VEGLLPKVGVTVMVSSHLKRNKHLLLSEVTIKDMEQEWKQYKQWAKMMLRSMKPWKMREDLSKPIDKVDYACGWNDCLKEMRKSEVKFFAEMDKLFPPQ
jgi:hypothetical protein